jgi:hypothetical protein
MASGLRMENDMTNKREGNSRQIYVLASLLLLILSLLGTRDATAETIVKRVIKPSLVVMSGEVMDVEDHVRGTDQVIYVVKDTTSGKLHRFQTDPYRTTIDKRGRIETPENIIGGAKGTMIYHLASGNELSTLVYFKVLSSYHS